VARIGTTRQLERMLLNRSWLLLTVPVGLAALGLLVATAVSLVRTVRGSVVTRVPVRAEQRVTLDRAGELALSYEGSMLSRGPAGLRFALTGADGAAVPLHGVLFRTRVSSFRRTRMELYDFTLRAPGAYVLRVEGLGPAEYGGDAIVFSRRFGAALVGHVLALVVLGAAFIGSMVATGLVFVVASGR
jgi:hypothetical protein